MPSQITFHFTLRDAAGRLVDTSQGGPPIQYMEGDGSIIDGLAAALRDLPAGARKQVTVPAEQGYGLRDESLVRQVPRRLVPVAEIKPGDQFRVGADRHAPLVTVIAVDGEDVVLDANHPLAGLELNFEVEVVAVRPVGAGDAPRGPASS